MSDNSIESTCKSVIQFVFRNWRRLPYAEIFDQPIDLSATLIVCQDFRIKSSSTHGSVFDAVSVAIDETENPLFLSAVNGGGKTTSLLWLAQKLAQARIQKSSRWLPVYIDLGQLGEELVGGNLEGLISAQLKRRKPIDFQGFRDHLEDCFFLIDGLDLLRDTLSARMLVDQALNCSFGRFLFSGRPDESIVEVLGNWDSSAQIETGSMNRRVAKMRLKDLIAKTGSANRTMITSSDFTNTLLANPLMFAMTATVMFEAFEANESERDALACKTTLFANFVKFTVRRAQRNRRLPAKDVDVDGLCRSLGSIALAAIRNNYYDRIPRARTKQLIQSTQNEFNWPNVQAIFNETGLIEETASSFKFAHQDFADFFAGNGLAYELMEFENHAKFEAIVFNQLAFTGRDVLFSHAISILVQLQGKGGLVQRIFDLVFNRDSHVACHIFALNGDPNVIGYLFEKASDKNQSESNRETAVKSISEIRHPDANIAFEKIIRQSSKYLQRQVWKAMHAINDGGHSTSSLVLQNIANDSQLPEWIRVLAGINHSVTFSEEHIDELFEKATKTKILIPGILVQIWEVIERYRDSKESIDKKATWDPVFFEVESTDALGKHSIPIDLDTQSTIGIKNQIVQLNMILGGEICNGLDLSSLDIPLDENEMSNNSMSEHSIIDYKDAAIAVNRLLSLIDQPEIVLANLTRQLMSICNDYPSAFEAIEANPLSEKLPSHVWACCALVAGRRWRIVDINQDIDSAIEEKPIKFKKEMPLLLAGFIKHCQKHNIKMTVNQCFIYSESVNGNWSRASLAAAMKRHHVIKEYRKNKTLANKSRTTRKSKPR